ncbi:SGNH/GDSL hydrolase family protein [Virgibacillus halophilus]|uniref:SGNH/GDSL hydrolase family protein n=1 Tax=Tigheibacillus halophilus TaxID=361280 RepID=A0ABU5C3X2_9BACI|nr:SGNH/GDSL hydrolase family protein [Virgibacillus halophilus]
MPVREMGESIVFIGDSITEDGRFQDENMLGEGYVRIIHDYLQAKYPDNTLKIINKGISGNRITDLQERWQADILEQQVEVVSISIGVNDVWRQLDRPEMEQIDPGKFEEIYHALLTSLQDRPNTKVILMEPTIIGEDADTKGNRLLQDYVAIVKKMSLAYETALVPLHHIFTSHLQRYPNQRLTTDGVHMNDSGRQLMAAAWLEALKV